MKLNRKARRAAKQQQHRPTADMTPQQQMAAFLKQPGKFHIVQLPEGKSFAVKVTEAEMPLFLTMCQQLRGTLGQCDAYPATPVDASVADTQQIAESTAQSTLRIREARQRQEAAEGESAEAELNGAKREAGADRQRAARRSGRHRAAEPDTTFDQLAAAVPGDEDAARRAAAIELAAAHDQSARAQQKLDEANERLRDAYDRGGELHNAAVLDKFAARAGDEIAARLDEPGHFPEPVITPAANCGIRCPFCSASIEGPDPKVVRATYDDHITWHTRESGIGENPTQMRGRIESESIDQAEPTELHTVNCDRDECGWRRHDTDKGRLLAAFVEHRQTHGKADGDATA